MKHTVTCTRCGAVCEYDDKSAWEGNRDFENVDCSKCENVIGRVFTDLDPRSSLHSQWK